MKQKTGERTLLASVILSAPGPIAVGIGLLLGRSSTQLADFVRRSAELFGIVVAWAVFRALNRGNEPDAARKARLERTANLCVGAAMCVSGGAMAVLALFFGNADKGNVVPGLVIAILGVATNCWFWLRYRKLDRERQDAIIRSQSALYRAKTLVDGCVTVALTAVAASPASALARWMDLGGSVFVSLYLIATGILTIRACVRRGG